MTRESWTDERLDDLSKRVDDGFRDTHAEFGLVRSEMRTEFALVRADMRTEFASVRSDMRTEFASVRTDIGYLRSEMREELGSIHGELAAMNRTLIIALFGIVATLLGALVAAFVSHLF